MDEITVMAGLVRDLQKECDGHLSSRICSIFGDVRHGDAVIMTVLDIHDIKARGEASDIFQVRELLEYFPGETGLVRQADRNAFQTIKNFFGFRIFIHGEFTELLKGSPGDVSRVFGVSVQYYDLHFSSPQ